MNQNSQGPLLWSRAKKIIPGGTQLLSKRSERFLPGLWPAYYSKAKGCEVWDLEGQHYYDFAQMGVGSCILGYADEDVNQAVINSIQKGSMCSLNCPEEVELAERLISLHPWAHKVRFAKTGGEACAIAIRIARAATNRSKVAFCGYHGWHDWYIAANLGDSASLDEQLLPGLAPKGVPRELAHTALPFAYNDLQSLKNLIVQYGRDIGVIIMEPERSVSPIKGFLEGVKALAKEIGAVLIFDEVTSGFRMNLGGIHLLRDVTPDIAIFGKALGNGFPIAAIIGHRDVMEHAQDSFISSTYWTERIGFVAALATLDQMEQKKVQKDLIHYGERLNEGWRKLAARHALEIDISGISPLTHLSFKTPLALEAQTLYAQEMLEKGYLLGASVYATHAYSDNIIDRFTQDSDSIFEKIRAALDSGNFKSYLKGDVIFQGFKRLV